MTTDDGSENVLALAGFPEGSDDARIEIRVAQDLVAAFTYSDNREFWIRLLDVSAIRYLHANYTGDEYLGIYFDQLVEIFDSRWVDETAAALYRPGTERPLRHFAFYADEQGYVEALAADWETGGELPFPPNQDR